MRQSVPLSPLQKAIVDRLLAALATTEIGDRIYDAAPQAPTFPLVVLGDFDVLPVQMKGACGVQATTPIDIYTAGDVNEGMKELQAIVDATSRALTAQSLDLSADGLRDASGNPFISCKLTREWNGLVVRRRASMVFQWLVQDVS
jgi:hypothetical protein